MSQLLYRIGTVMELLACSRSTIYRLIDRGQLELVKIGDASRITSESIETLINRKIE